MITTNHFGISAKNKKQTISFAGGTNLNISNAWLTTNGWDGKTSVILINTAQIISATTATAALIISATMPSGRSLQLVNNGGIYGKGGAGQPNNGGSTLNGLPGGIGLSAQSPCIIVNNSIIAGGGGSGGVPYFGPAGASGAGADQNGGGTGASGSSSGIGAGVPTNGAAGNDIYGAGNAGAGGSAGGGSSGQAGMGGGGAWGSNGGRSGYYTGGSYTAYGTGGAGGAAISGQLNIIWAVTGNRYGAIS